ncbi:MAG TPA: glutamate synthase large subunit [Acidimicrobiales bacterium]|nr:glutamate synthase large subunit [Acidimicrobiales bacterium]
MAPKPEVVGLYDPANEHDACGVAFVAELRRPPSHAVVDLALTALENLAHRGAFGSDAETGDGAGILLQMPDRLFRAVAGEEGIALPPVGQYGTGLAFLPRDAGQAALVAADIALLAAEEGLAVLGWREVPARLEVAGASARQVAPLFAQVFLGWAPGAAGSTRSPAELERRLFVLRKRAEHAREDLYFPSLSARTFVYKGMLATHQLRGFFPDLTDERLQSAIALVHSRFSTNTFPAWPLAHPYRLIAHNGEINTLKGNRNWMRARESMLASEVIAGDLERIFPVITPGASDSASFDEVLELLHLAGRSLPHAVLMMIPEAWENHRELEEARRAFYEYHSCLMEPWDGPAAVAFSDGSVVGAVLDRNGLRPARYWVTDEGLVVLASEVGVLDIDPSHVVERGRLQPGRMFLVDTVAGRIVSDSEVKASLAAERPYRDWLDEGLVNIDDLPPRRMLTPQHASVIRHQRLFGVTAEDLRTILGPMATSGAEPIGSMGTDTPIAVLSERPRLLYDYFSQLFAQVTNPPLDAIREELVTSIRSTLGPEANLLEPGPANCRQIVLPHPVLDNDELAKLLYVAEDGGVEGFSAFAVDGLWPVADGGDGLEAAIAKVCSQVSEAIALGVNIIVLSDRHASAELAPIPSLLLTAAVHNHLVRAKERTHVGLVVESGEAREVHHLALLIGYGAAAVNPYLAFDSIAEMARDGVIAGLTERQAIRNYVKAASKGVLKVMSKMGISTIASYTGAQVFEAVGLAQSFVDRHFTGTPSRLGGVDAAEIAAEVARRHEAAFSERARVPGNLEIEVGGEYQWRRDGEYHLFNPRTVHKLQHSTRARRYDVFKEYTQLVDSQAEQLATLRGLLRFRPGARAPLRIEEVEPVASIMQRFATGAMSYGSISAEAHETLAVAMNRIGARSNTGEGGEDPERYVPDPNGDSRRSAVKQVASGRFGVTSEYLVNADDLQIKIAQGAKPGEGGQLPGHKVYPWIARTRYSTPGVGLISPPPHHDIYSIEDIAQLIYDLKNANPRARIHVKLVSEVGVGTVATGVAKAHADVVLISGHDGGTGAAPLTSLKHAGTPWELGLAETQQTLVRNGLRDRIVVQVDGQMKTGRDVVVAALLGAEEFGFATAPLVVSGCVMMRVCHLDTCPVGIATQNPELRKRFSGRPEFVETFFEYIATEVREILASLGFTSLAEAVGHVECLEVSEAVDHYWKAHRLDLRPILAGGEDLAGGGPAGALHCTRAQDHGLEGALDHQLIAASRAALERGERVRASFEVRNIHRSVGTMLGHEVTRRHGGAGLPDGTIEVTLTGSAGQSFGAFLPKGVTLRLVGDANDYFGKGLSGGHLVLRPHESSPSAAEHQVIAGNVVLYGATGGEAFISGQVGERFCVRNSGATAVVEGVGDHACEYMTGGTVVVLGSTGRNFAAGMSGGVAYVYDPDGLLERRCNPEMVALEALDPEDARLVTELLARHLSLTGSALAGRLLAARRATLEATRKVMPLDYRRVLEATRLAIETGSAVDEAIMAAAHG